MLSTETTQYNKLQKVNVQLRLEKDSIQARFRRHLSKCAFISKQSIQIQRGRYITLYSNINTNRK